MEDKIIHYCWFGNNRKSKLINKCINSWKKFFPDYRIIEWNENNFDITCCDYVNEAYRAGKWAFVSDYVRFSVLNKYGGVYFDTDVEVLKPFDELLKNPVAAMEDSETIATGLVMACRPDDAFCKWMLNSYQNDHFLNTDGTYNLYTVCERSTDFFKSQGFVEENKIQKIAGYTIYPPEYFCPYRCGEKKNITENTFTCHHYAASWMSKKNRFIRFLQRVFGNEIISRVVSIRHRLLLK